MLIEVLSSVGVGVGEASVSDGVGVGEASVSDGVGVGEASVPDEIGVGETLPDGVGESSTICPVGVSKVNTLDGIGSSKVGVSVVKEFIEHSKDILAMLQTVSLRVKPDRDTVARFPSLDDIVLQTVEETVEVSVQFASVFNLERSQE